jgi:hypothetical protein
MKSQQRIAGILHDFPHHKRLGQNPMRFPNILASAIAAFGVFLCLAGPSFGEEDMKTDPL